MDPTIRDIEAKTKRVKRPSRMPLAFRYGLLVGGVAGGVVGYMLRMNNQGAEPTANLIFWCAGVGAAAFGVLFWTSARLIGPLREAVIFMIDGARSYGKPDDALANIDDRDS